MPIPDDVQAKDVTVDIRPGMACFFLSRVGGVPLHSITLLMPMLQALSPVGARERSAASGGPPVERHSGRRVGLAD